MLPFLFGFSISLAVLTLISSLPFFLRSGEEGSYQMAQSSPIQPQTKSAPNAIKVGNDPGAIAINPITNTIYVSNVLSNSISVINGLTNKVVDKDQLL